MTKEKLNLKFEFRHLLLAAAILTYLVIVLGVLTRVTAGGGCPDWPTCYGSWTAPVQTQRPARLCASRCNIVGWGIGIGRVSLGVASVSDCSFGFYAVVIVCLGFWC